MKLPQRDGPRWVVEIQSDNQENDRGYAKKVEPQRESDLTGSVWWIWHVRLNQALGLFEVIGE
jgi:hypothetical protein